MPQHGRCHLQQCRTSVEPHIILLTVCSEADSEPTGKLAEAIKRDFGSFENFKKEFNAAAVGLSVWMGLVVCRQERQTHITKEANGSNRYAPVLVHNCFDVANAKIGNAEDRAREIIDERKHHQREAMLEAKEESIRVKNDWTKK